MLKVAINGFGRIGRVAFRIMDQMPEVEIVAINDLTDAETLAYLAQYDSAQGLYRVGEIRAEGSSLVVGDKVIPIFAQKDPSTLPWGELGVDLVMECTGFFTEVETAGLHLQAGAKRVIISSPAGKGIKTIVYNVNHETLTAEDTIISGASCTTNCLAPVVDALDKEFGVVRGFMTTVHAYTNDQSLVDQPHKKGILARRGRAAAESIIPSSTGAAKAIGLVLPQLKGKLDGTALRVPVVAGSIVDLTVELARTVTKDEVHTAIKKYASETLLFTTDPIVSSDVIGNPHSSVFDGNTTQILTVGETQLVKVMSWYDNEYGYTAQMVRTAIYAANLK
jgi:glyceraldehyde 3-phosphate dehydrogenase